MLDHCQIEVWECPALTLVRSDDKLNLAEQITPEGGSAHEESFVVKECRASEETGVPSPEKPSLLASPTTPDQTRASAFAVWEGTATQSLSDGAGAPELSHAVARIGLFVVQFGCSWFSVRPPPQRTPHPSGSASGSPLAFFARAFSAISQVRLQTSFPLMVRIRNTMLCRWFASARLRAGARSKGSLQTAQ